MRDQKEKIKALLDKAAKDLSQPMQDALYEFGCRVVDYDEAEQLQATNKELLSALEAVIEFGNNIHTKRGSWAMSKADNAITNAKAAKAE